MKREGERERHTHTGWAVKAWHEVLFWEKLLFLKPVVLYYIGERARGGDSLILFSECCFVSLFPVNWTHSLPGHGYTIRVCLVETSVNMWKGACSSLSAECVGDCRPPSNARILWNQTKHNQATPNRSMELPYFVIVWCFVITAANWNDTLMISFFGGDLSLILVVSKVQGNLP